MSIAIIVIYTLALTLLFFYCLMQLSLAIHYLKYKKNLKEHPENIEMEIPEGKYPFVTVQLPIYNELYVIERLIDAVCEFDYPKDKFEVQVLDDSIDETVELVAKRVAEWKEKGINIIQLRRIGNDRKGFKAGALQEGLKTAKGEFIAIFDADFVPYPDFLLKTIPHFLHDNKVGVVQTKWEHLNKDYSILTKMQAFALDMHFTIEQTGRNAAGYFINFNGTAGLWRKATITEAGGWMSDTLTEDLDLSYRAQLKGWKFKYVEGVVSPSELPTDMNAVKSQQFRWNKGGAETAKKMGRSIMKSQLPLKVKLHAIAHLFNTTNYIFIFLTGILSVPLLLIKNVEIQFNYFKYASVFLIGSIAIAYSYYVSTQQREITAKKTWKVFLARFPVFLAITMGLSLHNAWAVFRGWLGHKTAFVRTPKFNIISSKDIWKNKKYIPKKIHPITYIEGLLTLYFLSGVVMGLYYGDYGLMPFHMMAAIGFGLIFYFSMKHSRIKS
ncbi:MAG: glycosyltransferase [Fimbriimonadaceae bacterium]|nr:glycosyltransferase [Chitinophagales bacterium]